MPHGPPSTLSLDTNKKSSYTLEPQSVSSKTLKPRTPLCRGCRGVCLHWFGRSWWYLTTAICCPLMGACVSTGSWIGVWIGITTRSLLLTGLRRGGCWCLRCRWLSWCWPWFCHYRSTKPVQAHHTFNILSSTTIYEKRNIQVSGAGVSRHQTSDQQAPLGSR